MKLRKLILPIVFLVMAVCGVQAAPSTSFMTKPAPDAKGLVKLVSTDRGLSTRYTKHFNTTPAAIVSYFRENLRLGQLTRPHVTAVYSIGLDGNAVKKVVTLAPGTRVFSTVWGEPVIEWETGNPLIDRLPLPPENKVLAAAPGNAKPEEQQTAVVPGQTDDPNLNQLPEEAKTSIAYTTDKLDEVVTKVMAAPATELPSNEGQSSAVSAVGGGDNVGGDPTLIAALPTPSTGSTASPAGTGRGISSYSNWWRPVAAVGGGLAALAAASGGSSAESSSLNPDVSDNPPIPPNPVPEPASLLALSAGLAFIARRKMR